MRLLVALLAFTAALAGCALAPGSAHGLSNANVPWLDAVFDADESLVAVTPAELFALPADLRARLDAARPGSRRQQADQLLTLLFGADRRGFGYTAGRTTTAAGTWERRRGDCLSLTVLTYSAARYLGLYAQLQQVPVPPVFDRRGNFDIVNAHVNVLLPKVVRNWQDDAQPRDMVVDFDPALASSRRGKPLDEAAIVARYYNNIAVEHMAAGDTRRAYAHFRAALRSDPDFASAYTNLATLYRSAGHASEAELLLRTAVQLADEPQVPLHALHQMLVAQGRAAEAVVLARRLDAMREADPYHWLALGQQQLRDGEARRAVASFERARELAPAFPEVHRWLALSYGRAGQPLRADEALDELAHLGERESKLAALRRKLGRVE